MTEQRKYVKLEIFIPETHFSALRKALQEADAGHIGAYDSCLAYSHVPMRHRRSLLFLCGIERVDGYNFFREYDIIKRICTR